jgi:hypothetical protein
VREARANFAYLVTKFRSGILTLVRYVAAPFNKIGFQTSPSAIEFEKALQVPEGMIAMSILAAGYLKFPEAVSI